ncbi:hypothetical protein [Brevibacterium album]|uniref:hypothetical protein n=1 Tax=Brevibacterium album TaxID=417948 RepID=UPI0004207666|nr:hypothetical protein [Brevibacterium album]
MEPPPLHWASREKTVTLGGRPLRLRRWGWSRDSPTAAAEMAAARIEKLIAAGGPLPEEHGRRKQSRDGAAIRRLHDYYPASPQREEVLEEVCDDDGRLIAALTRNRYGALILNTDALLIADVDLPEPQTRTGGLLSLFRRRDRGAGSAHEDASAAALAAVTAFAADHPDLGVRTYRTRGGFRVCITGSGARPGSPEAEALFSALGTDELYTRLCRTAGTCRARLTPKPWRIGCGRLPVRWPPDSATARRAYGEWVRRYEAASANHSVCEIVAEASSPALAALALPGPGSAPSGLTPSEMRVLRLHDLRSGVGAETPLA